MAQRIIDKIRNAVKSGNYDMTHHATEEMAEDELGIYDIECAILKGKIIKKETDDPRGVKFVIKGVGVDPVYIYRNSRSIQGNRSVSDYNSLQNHLISEKRNVWLYM